MAEVCRLNSLEKAVLDVLERSEKPLTVAELEHRHFPRKKARKIQKAVRKLVGKGLIGHDLYWRLVLLRGRIQ